MASSEYNIESVVILILAGQASLPAAKHYDDNTDTVTLIERMAVKCAPKTPFFNARSMFLAPVLWQGQVTIEIQNPTSATVSAWDTLKGLIDAAMTGTPPAAAITAATTSFPQGIGFDIVNGGDTQATGNDTRNLTRTYRAFWAEA